MSKLIASAAIRGAHNIVERAEKEWQEAMDKWGANEPVGFPNTAYYLPVIYGILGVKVEKLWLSGFEFTSFCIIESYMNRAANMVI